METHRSRHHELILIRSGSGQLSGWGESIDLYAPMLIHIPPHTPHRFVDSRIAPLTLTNLSFQESVLTENRVNQLFFSEFLRQAPTLKPLLLSNEFRRHTILEFYRNLTNEQTFAKVGYQAATLSYLIQLFTYLVRISLEEIPSTHNSRHTNAVTACLEYLKNNFHEPLRIDDLAGLTPYSTRRLSSLFKEQTGETLHSYINHLRIEYAQRRLSTSGNIAQIAFESGFNELSTFYRTFKTATGMTPGEFRAITNGP